MIIKNKYLRLIRFDKPIGTLLLFYPLLFSFFYVAPFTAKSLYLLFLFFLGSFFIRSAGCIINDIIDREIDSKITRTKNRPIASGEIGLFRAFILLFIFLLLGLLILFLLNIKSFIFLAYLILIPIILYPFAKRFFNYPQIFLGLTFNLGIFLVWLSLFEYINLSTILMYISAVFWTIGYDTIYAYQDKEEDLQIGVKSTAISFGRYVHFAIFICYAIFLILILIIGFASSFGIIYFITMQIAILFILQKISSLDLTSKEQCNYVFNKINNRIMLLIIFAIIVGRLEQYF